MRRSVDYYPDQVDFTCTACWADNIDVKVIAVEADDVVVTCPECGEEQYERVIYDD